MTVWPASMHSSVTFREANLISRSVRRSLADASALAARMAFSILEMSKATSEPFRLMIFMLRRPFAKEARPPGYAVLFH